MCLFSEVYVNKLFTRSTKKRPSLFFLLPSSILRSLRPQSGTQSPPENQIPRSPLNGYHGLAATRPGTATLFRQTARASATTMTLSTTTIDDDLMTGTREHRPGSSVMNVLLMAVHAGGHAKHTQTDAYRVQVRI